MGMLIGNKDDNDSNLPLSNPAVLRMSKKQYAEFKKQQRYAIFKVSEELAEAVVKLLHTKK